MKKQIEGTVKKERTQEGGPLTDPAQQEEKMEALISILRDIAGAADILHYVIKDIDLECSLTRANALVTVNDILHSLCNKGYNIVSQDLGSLQAEGGQL